MNCFDAYVMYSALKLHYTDEKYDYFKYGGKVRNCNQYNFERRKDKKFFSLLVKNYPYSKNCEKFLVSNFMKNKNFAMYEIMSPTAKENYKNFELYNNSYSYYFDDQLNKIKNEGLDKNITLKKSFLLKKDKFSSFFLDLVFSNYVELQTACIVDELIDLFNVYNKKIEFDPLFRDLYLNVKKTKPFLEFNKENMREILNCHLKQE